MKHRLSARALALALPLGQLIALTGASAQRITATAAAVPVPVQKPAVQVTFSPQMLQQLQQAQLATVPKSPLAAHLPWLTHTFAGIFMVAAVGLVLLLAFQTTKQEGLSGTIGGRVEAAYRPRLGFDQQLARLTSIVAITFVIFATFISLSGI